MYMYMGSLSNPLEWADTEPVADYFNNCSAAELGTAPEAGPPRFRHRQVLLLQQRSGRRRRQPEAAGVDQPGHGQRPGVPHQPAQWPVPQSGHAGRRQHDRGAGLRGACHQAGAADRRNLRPARSQRRVRQGQGDPDPGAHHGRLERPRRGRRYWFFRPDAFTDAFMVPEETFRDRISLFNKGEIYLAVGTR